MAINDCVISGPDPGAVPGASTGVLRARRQKSEVGSRKMIPNSDFRIQASGAKRHGGGEIGSTDV